MSRHGAGKQNEIQAQFEDYLEETIELYEHYIIDPAPFSGWLLEVVTWYNDWICNGWSYKTPQLYLYGTSNVGKSRLIRHLFGKTDFFFLVFFKK